MGDLASLTLADIYERAVKPKPDCAVCGRPFHSHSGGSPNTCPIIATYRPKPARQVGIEGEG